MNIPEAAIEAAVQRQLLSHDDHPDRLQPWVAEECRKIAIEVLTAALPHLGEQEIEYALRYTAGDGAVRVTWLPTRKAALEIADEDDTLVCRMVIRGEWTEVQP